MNPQATSVTPPIQLRIADDIRMKIERGDLRPGDALPSTQELSALWSCSAGPVRAAVALLKKQGLITTASGRRPVVRVPRRLQVLDHSTGQSDKDRALLPEEERRKQGSAESILGVPIEDLDFTARFATVPADEELAAAFGVEPGHELLRREYEVVDRSTGLREQWAVSWLRVDQIAPNPELLDEGKEPWPGGTYHQLWTVGIEIDRVAKEITARMPTTVEAQKWGLPDGEPLLCGGQTTYDIEGRVVEVSIAQYPADRAKLLFSTQYERWSR
jgi:GntR family transcriptional regulator